MIHPMHSAAYLAKCLERDPVAASQVKEHISPERLRELLGISAELRSRLSSLVELQFVQLDVPHEERRLVRRILEL